jgi:hypothetical protein
MPRVGAGGDEMSKHAEDPKVRYVKVRICQACIDGEGRECHTPECALFLHSVDLPIYEELIDDVTPAEKAAPDLLELAEHFKDGVEASMDGEDFDWIEILYPIACEAIARARGEW